MYDDKSQANCPWYHNSFLAWINTEWENKLIQFLGFSAVFSPRNANWKYKYFIKLKCTHPEQQSTTDPKIRDFHITTTQALPTCIATCSFFLSHTPFSSWNKHGNTDKTFPWGPLVWFGFMKYFYFQWNCSEKLDSTQDASQNHTCRS